MVTWYSNIPQPTDLISNSQPQILTNNASINTIFNDMTNGNFTKFLMQNVGTIASLTDPVSALHAINGANFFSGHPVPYFKNSVGDYPLMADLLTSGTAYSFQIGPMIIKFGVVTLGAGFDQDFTLSGGGSLGIGAFPTAFLMVMANINTSTVGPETATLTVQTYVNNTNSFHVKTSSTTKITKINFIAIGY
jgi:hypothetical protein